MVGGMYGWSSLQKNIGIRVIKVHRKKTHTRLLTKACVGCVRG